jgi:3-hydroxybutyryl-CoA dehydrogenase
MKSADEIRTCAVLGAGTMGAGIAQVAAQAGMDVRLFDIDESATSKGMERITGMLDKGVARGKVSEEQRIACLAQLSTSTELAAAVEGCDLVIEAIPEKLELKRSVFATVAENVSADCLLASNTSSLSIGKIGEGLPSPERFVGTHFFNPVPLMPLLESRAGPRQTRRRALTCDRVARWARAALARSRSPVRDTPGFASSVAWAWRSGSRRSAWSRRGWRPSPRTSTRRWSSATATRWGRCELTDLVGRRRAHARSPSYLTRTSFRRPALRGARS